MYLASKQCMKFITRFIKVWMFLLLFYIRLGNENKMIKWNYLRHGYVLHDWRIVLSSLIYCLNFNNSSRESKVLNISYKLFALQNNPVGDESKRVVCPQISRQFCGARKIWRQMPPRRRIWIFQLKILRNRTIKTHRNYSWVIKECTQIKKSTKKET